jgi:hypothetical protein
MEMKKLLALALIFSAPVFATVSDTSLGRVTYTTDGSQTVFPFSFPASSSADIIPYLSNISCANGGCGGYTYTVTLNADQIASPGGTVTFSPHPAPQTLKIQREMQTTQTLSISPYYPFPARAVEKNFDRTTLLIQQVQRGLSDAIIAAGGGGSGVSSVGLSMPGIFTVTNSPLVSAGTLNVALNAQIKNTVFAGPTSGANDIPAFRTLVAADFPALGPGGVGGAFGDSTHTVSLTIGASGLVTAASTNATALAGIPLANVFTNTNNFTPSVANGYALQATGHAPAGVGVPDDAIRATGGVGNSVANAHGGYGALLTGGAGTAVSPAGSGIVAVAGAAGAAGGAAAGTFTGTGAFPGLTSQGGSTGAGGTFSGGATSGAGLTASATSGDGATFTGGTAGNGITSTGGATGAGVRGIGGASSGAGGVFTGTAGNSNGVTTTGQGSASGINSTGGATGAGGTFAGGSPAAGSNGGVGMVVTAGTTNASSDGLAGGFGEQINGTAGTTASTVNAQGGSGGYALQVTSGAGGTGNGSGLGGTGGAALQVGTVGAGGTGGATGTGGTGGRVLSGTAGVGGVPGAATGSGGVGGDGVVVVGGVGGAPSGAGTGGNGGSNRLTGGAGGAIASGAGSAGIGGTALVLIGGNGGAGGASGTGGDAGLGLSVTGGNGGSGLTGGAGARAITATGGNGSGTNVNGSGGRFVSGTGGSGTSNGWAIELSQSNALKAHINMNLLASDPSSLTTASFVDLWAAGATTTATLKARLNNVTQPVITFGANGANSAQTATVAGCATAASLNATCTSVVTWPVAYPDANYKATCTGNLITSGVPVLQVITATAAASVTIQTLSITAAAAQFTNIQCAAIHN